MSDEDFFIKCEKCGKKNKKFTGLFNYKTAVTCSSCGNDLPKFEEPKCPACGTVVWLSYECPNCKTRLIRQGINIMPIEKPKPQAVSTGLVTEYKRTCLRCGKVWYSSVAREQSLQRNQTNYSEQSFGDQLQALNSFGPKGQGQYESANIANESELVRSKQCPSCGSVSYNEEIV
jgi:ribosomal protein L37E